MIKRVILENFKYFKKQSFDIDEAVVLAGPNNSGKTTLLQAIAMWHFALNKWLMEKRSGAKKRTGVPITRQELFAVPISELDLLWKDASTALKKKEGKPGAPRLIRIILQGETMREGKEHPWKLAMEFRFTNSELLYARPADDPIPEGLEKLVVYVPSFSGISVDEQTHAREYQDWLIGQGKPGDTLRNLLVEVSKEPEQWKELNEEVGDVFGWHLLPPCYKGPFIRCEYLPGKPPEKGHGGLPKLEIATAGSGFLQILMLLAFFYARNNAVVYLLDEPDAHLHTVLQGQMYDRFRRLAEEKRCQLMIATHSEVLINRTDADKIISFYGKPHKLRNRCGRMKSTRTLRGFLIFCLNGLFDNVCVINTTGIAALSA